VHGIGNIEKKIIIECNSKTRKKRKNNKRSTTGKGKKVKKQEK
jgi:hypothetical protein